MLWQLQWAGAAAAPAAGRGQDDAPRLRDAVPCGGDAGCAAGRDGGQVPAGGDRRQAGAGQRCPASGRADPTLRTTCTRPLRQEVSELLVRADRVKAGHAEQQQTAQQQFIKLHAFYRKANQQLKSQLEAIQSTKKE